MNESLKADIKGQKSKLTKSYLENLESTLKKPIKTYESNFI